MSACSPIPNTNRTSEYSPEYLFPISTRIMKNGSTRVSLRFKKKMVGNFIYQFRNKVTGEIYVGETRRLNGRVSMHLSTANRSDQPSVKKTSQKLYAALKKNPENFEFGIIEVKGSPRKLEVLAIEYYKRVALKILYNRNRGGGGPKGKLPPSSVSKISISVSKIGPKSKIKPTVVKSLTSMFDQLGLDKENSTSQSVS